MVAEVHVAITTCHNNIRFRYLNNNFYVENTQQISGNYTIIAVWKMRG